MGELDHLMTPVTPLAAVETPTILLVPNRIFVPIRGLPTCLLW